MTSRTHFARKEVDDVMGGEEGWKNVDQGEGELVRLTFNLSSRDLTFYRDTAQCPKCDSHRAYFRQLQIRRRVYPSCIWPRQFHLTQFPSILHSADEPMTTFL